MLFGEKVKLCGNGCVYFRHDEDCELQAQDPGSHTEPGAPGAQRLSGLRAAGVEPVAEFGLFFGGHLFPAFLHTVAPVAAIARAGAAATESTEEEPTENEQTEALPKRDGGEMEERGHEPVPQMENDLAKDEEGERHNKENKHNDLSDLARTARSCFLFE